MPSHLAPFKSPGPPKDLQGSILSVPLTSGTSPPPLPCSSHMGLPAEGTSPPPHPIPATRTSLQRGPHLPAHPPGPVPATRASLLFAQCTACLTSRPFHTLFPLPRSTPSKYPQNPHPQPPDLYTNATCSERLFQEILSNVQKSLPRPPSQCSCCAPCSACRPSLSLVSSTAGPSESTRKRRTIFPSPFVCFERHHLGPSTKVLVKNHPSGIFPFPFGVRFCPRTRQHRKTPRRAVRKAADRHPLPVEQQVPRTKRLPSSSSSSQNTEILRPIISATVTQAVPGCHQGPG